MANVPARVGAQFVPDERGLAIEGTAQRIDFGRSPKGVVPVLERELGRGQAIPLTGCPDGVAQQVDWDGLILTFTNERFVGWRTASARAGQACA
ncbi:hypothetical protein [Maritimibacter sp. UBA3975]|uniref:hypothetical protein n=1 Tax=Maritimibacter sp. UBA3975 TaxID=1946833 RepID=UPI0025BC2D89|nr:hypothetical protein [Maritimibacter sp. UBA3975]